MENYFDYLSCKKIDTAINRAKKVLIDRAKRDGIYENFGQKEVREIKDTFIRYGDYSKEMNANRDKINAFDDWCMTYTGR